MIIWNKTPGFDCISWHRAYVCFRSHAIACVNQFIISRTQALMLHIDAFIEVNKNLLALWRNQKGFISCDSSYRSLIVDVVVHRKQMQLYKPLFSKMTNHKIKHQASEDLRKKYSDVEFWKILKSATGTVNVVIFAVGKFYENVKHYTRVLISQYQRNFHSSI